MNPLPNEENALLLLKAGDSVLLHQPFTAPTVDYVERVTKTQIMTRYGGKFRKKNGRVISQSPWYQAWITVPILA